MVFGSLWFDLLDLFGLDDDVFVLAEFVAFDNLAALHYDVLHRADVLLLYTLLIRTVQHVDEMPELRAPENRRTGMEIRPKVR